MFEEYKDLYELTRKTVDEHIEFYKKKESLPVEDLFTVWKKLSQQAANFDKKDWTENWHNWHKNLHAFEKHKFEARFLIQNYLTDVLEELIGRIMRILEKYLESEDRRKLPEETPESRLSDLIRQEVKRQVKEELANQKRKPKKRKK
ncbi:MAG: hypothetical protein ACREBI_02395 [Nitrosotalea sp.]